MLPKALRGSPKSKISPNLVTLVVRYVEMPPDVKTSLTPPPPTATHVNKCDISAS